MQNTVPEAARCHNKLSLHDSCILRGPHVSPAPVCSRHTEQPTLHVAIRPHHHHPPWHTSHTTEHRDRATLTDGWLALRAHKRDTACPWRNATASTVLFIHRSELLPLYPAVTLYLATVFNPYSPTVTICTTRYNNHKFYVLPKQCTYVFCLDLRTNSDYFPIQH